MRYKLPSQRNAGAVCLLYLNQNTLCHLYWQLWPDSLPGLNHPVLLALTTQAWTTQCHWHWQHRPVCLNHLNHPVSLALTTQACCLNHLNHPVSLALTTQACCLSAPSEPPSVTGTDNRAFATHVNGPRETTHHELPWRGKKNKNDLVLKVLLTFAIQISTVHFI